MNKKSYSSSSIHLRKFSKDCASFTAQDKMGFEDSI